MKPKIFVLLLFINILASLFPMKTNGQTSFKSYDLQWKTVEGHLAKGLPKSALEEVKKIYTLAKKEKQEGQLIKSVIYMIDLQSENQENFETVVIGELEKEITSSNEPAKSILTSLLAKKYYYQYNTLRWQLYDRTATSGFKKDDFNTWTAEDFHAKISELYLNSIKHEALLKQTLLAPFDAIIVKGNSRNLRPTLFDLLSHEALQYFSTDERNVTKPAYAFEINNASAFASATDFVKAKFETKDSTALEFYALQLYQRLISFHLNDPQPDALIDVDLQRLQFAKEKSVHRDKDDLFFNAVKRIADQYQNAAPATQAWFLMASWYNERGEQYRAGKDTTYSFEKNKAVEICEKIAKSHPDTEGGVNAFNLLNTIRQKTLQFSTENVNVPGKPFRALVEYKNLNKLYLRIIVSTDRLKPEPMKGLTKENWQMLASAAALKSWEQSLPETNDYQQHSVEIKVSALPIGSYILLAATDPDFKNTKNIGGVRLFYVSNISYIQDENHYFVLNRDSGQPLSRANVRIWESNYDYATRTFKKQRGGIFLTDLNGHFKRKNEDETSHETNDLLEITHGNDRLFLPDPVYTHYFRDSDDEKENAAETIYLFTDRGIYRPGQTVFYKGIVKEGKKVLQDRDREISVVLRNANNEQVEKVSKKVNAYGSFSGQFHCLKAY